MKSNLKSKPTRKVEKFQLKGHEISFYNTTPLPNAMAKQLIKFCARGLSLGSIHIEFKNHGDYGRALGRAYNGVPYMATRAMATNASRLVVVKVETRKKWVVAADGRVPYLATINGVLKEIERGDWVNTKEIALESMVNTLAHELRHIHHFRNPKARMCRGKMLNCEKDARKFADRVVRRFKKEFADDA